MQEIQKNLLKPNPTSDTISGQTFTSCISSVLYILVGIVISFHHQQRSFWLKIRSMNLWDYGNLRKKSYIICCALYFPIHKITWGRRSFLCQYVYEGHAHEYSYFSYEASECAKEWMVTMKAHKFHVIIVPYVWYITLHKMLQITDKILVDDVYRCANPSFKVNYQS